MLFADLRSLSAFSPNSRCLGSTAHRRTPISLKRVRQEPSTNERIRTINLNELSASGSWYNGSVVEEIPKLTQAERLDANFGSCLGGFVFQAAAHGLKDRICLVEHKSVDDPEAVQHIHPPMPELCLWWRHTMINTVFCIERRDDDSRWRREMCFKTEFRAFVNARTKSMATLGSYRVVHDFDNEVVAEVDGRELTKSKRERRSRQQQ